MMLTPRQIAAYLEFGEKLDRKERANALAVTAIGTHGDEKAIKQAFKELDG